MSSFLLRIRILHAQVMTSPYRPELKLHMVQKNEEFKWSEQVGKLKFGSLVQK